MFSRQELQRYAQLLFWGLERGRRAAFKKEEFVLVQFDVSALPLVEEIYTVLLEKGLYPLIRVNSTPKMEFDKYSLATEDILRMHAPGEKELYESLSGNIRVIAPTSLNHLASVPSAKVNIGLKTQAHVAQAVKQREQNRQFGWTVGLFPSTALAEAAGISVAEYTEEVRRGCCLDKENCLEYWQGFSLEVAERVKWLNSFGNAQIHVEAENTDLHFSVGEERTWVSLTGRNIPSFETYVSPDWRSVSGTFKADMPSYRTGNIVKDVQFTFADGRLIEFTAEEGEDFALEVLNTDSGAWQIGEFALVDKRFSRINRFMANTLYDENFGGEHGSVHIALGQSYANTFAGEPAEFTRAAQEDLGFNASTVHWDFIATTDRRVSIQSAGGKKQCIYEKGIFIY